MVVVSPCFWQIFPTGCSMIFDCPVDRSWCAQRCCDGAATESLLRRSCADELRRAHSARRVRDAADAAAPALMLRAALLRCSCDGVATATELHSPAPSRSFCASRLDVTRRMSATELVCAARSQQRLRRSSVGVALQPGTQRLKLGSGVGWRCAY